MAADRTQSESADSRYFSFGRFLRQRFGTRVYRVTIDAGFTCPNVDGTVAVGGCVYCDNRSFSPNRRLPRQTIRDQVARGIALLQKRYRADKFIAYFQAATNTYAPVDKLKRLYDEALDHPNIVGLAIGTRPDCVPDPVLDLIEDYARRYYVCLELGLQTIHDRSLEWMNRGDTFASFVDAVGRCRGRDLDVCAHVILGLPGESHADMMATADALASLPVDAVKIHNLHVVRDTPLEKMYADGQVRMFTFEEYVQVVCDFLERLPASMVIQRLSGDAPPKYLVAPEWCLNKQALLEAIRHELVRRDSRQGPTVPNRPAFNKFFPSWGTHSAADFRIMDDHRTNFHVFVCSLLPRL
ncbi:MAG: TIGR01212 family radical SAM protein [Gemmatales bacterium]|nr:MAG: TIGR01212 family radical SAM protein [Gemmatales bacterium]